MSPKNFLYKRAHTNRFNPVGVGALALALVIALPMAFGLVGEMGKTLAPFVSGALAFIAAPLLALATRGRYYQPATVARNIDPALPPVGAGAANHIAFTATPETDHATCVVCAQTFELAEFALCPFHRGAICSVCCAADAHCKDMCKNEEQLRTGDPVLPTAVAFGRRRETSNA